MYFKICAIQKKLEKSINQMYLEPTSSYSTIFNTKFIE